MSTWWPWSWARSDERDLDVTTRSFRPGDVEDIVHLWERAYREYGGYVPRRPERWRWNVLDRPGTTDDDVRIVEDADGRLRAYGVLDGNGMVLELAVDPLVGDAARRKLTRRLLSSLEERARDRGVDRLRGTVPLDDAPVCEAFREADYREERSEALQLVFVDLIGFLRDVLEYRAERIPEGRRVDYRLELDPGAYRFAPHRQVHVSFTRPPVVTEATGEEDPDCVLHAELPDLADVVFGRIPAEQAVAGGAIGVEPAGAVDDARTLLELLTVEARWFSPMADGR